MLNKEIKNLSIATLTDLEKANGKGFIIKNNNVKSKKKNKKRQKEKCEDCKRCYGFCDFLTTSWKLFKEFSADTSIHGIKYLTDKQRHWTEKLFWAIALTLSIVACAYLIYWSLKRCLMSPLLLTFSPKPMNIFEIPFSAVTICPSGGLNPLNEYYNLTSLDSFEIPLKNFTDSTEKRITNLKWRNNDINISSDLFTEIITEEGFCYTFNMMNFDDLFNDNVLFESYNNLRNKKKSPPTQWELQEGFANRNPYAFPHRVAGSGENGGLKFEIWRDIIEVRESRSLTKGFKVVIHLPCEVPQFDKQYYRFPLEKSATLIIRPSMTVTENLEYYSPTTRQCYFEGEKKLQLFKKYTRSNCVLECLANYTRTRCGCIHHSMPRLKDVDVVCDLSKQSCFYDAKKNLIWKNMVDSLETTKNYDEIGKVACDCLPACTSLNYEGEISQDDIRYFNRNDRPLNAFRSRISILFKEDEFFFTRRSELYGWTDFIANFGGLLGLFLGVSILSIVEIIYFISFRQLNEESESHSRSHTPSIISNVSTRSTESKNDNDNDNVSDRGY